MKLLLALALAFPAHGATMNDAFAFALHAKLPKDGNLFYSPYSLSSALAMAWAGAGGETAAEMAKVLGFTQAAAEVHKDFQGTNEAINAVGKAGVVKLSAANSLWVEKTFALKKAFTDLCAGAYGGSANGADFKQAAGKARLAINAWVEGKTAGRIKDLVPEGGVHALTRLVIANAVYFKGDWEDPFMNESTQPASFTKADGAKVQAQFMNKTSWHRFAELPDVQLLELAYKAESVSMLIVLPKKRDGLRDVEKRLNAAALARWTAALEGRKVQVALPKFKLEQTLSADKALAELGMARAFDAAKADFSGMSEEKGVFIGAVLHKAFVAVDEKGTEAAAATAVMMPGSAMMSDPPPVFRADHPFLFLIRGPKGVLLFVGRLADPA
ncbi:MAG: serpin family protein [Elusimicrobia bacterium]|nr:serpin family protein [Elusimicrobiota bacterium]